MAETTGGSFDEVVLPHLDAAYRLAHWLMRNEHDAEDVVQEASLRAFRYFRTFTGGNGRAWFLRIVRNTCCGWSRHDVRARTDPFDEELHSGVGSTSDPETLLLHIDDVTLIDRAMRSLPDRLRELLALRELEGLSYRELADTKGIPMGTVMSSLSRARHALRGALDNEQKPSRNRGESIPTSDTKGHDMKKYVTALSMALTFALPPAADAQVVPPPVPADIQVPETSEAFLIGRAFGTQNYVCQPSASLGRVAWTLFTPQATLFNDLDEQLITHFFSPNPAEGNIVRATWEDSGDTSIVWARAIGSAVVDADAIAWVLLKTAGTQIGPTGGATLSQTTFIQRVNTTGGLAPATDCDVLKDVGHKAFVPYTADYVFYKN